MVEGVRRATDSRKTKWWVPLNSRIMITDKGYYLNSCISTFEESIGSSCKAWLFI
mgnify:CR=1 FL=1